MQDIWNAFEMHLKLRVQQLKKKSCIYIDGYIKPHGNHKPQIHNRYIYTEKWKRNPNWK